jgi:GNAT superfamily N-acetyltransferase
VRRISGGDASQDWRVLDGEDGVALQELFERDAAFFEESFGHPPGAEAASAFLAVPDGFPLEDKVLLGSFGEDGRMLAFADVLRGWPMPRTWTVATLFVDPVERGHGLSDTLWARLEEIAVREGAGRLRAAPAVEQQHATAFFRRNGMEPLAEVTRRIGLRDLRLVVMEKSLGGHHS